MPKLIYVGPLGEVEVLGRVVSATEPIEVDDDTAKDLLSQEGNYSLVKPTTPAAQPTKVGE